MSDDEIQAGANPPANRPPLRPQAGPMSNYQPEAIGQTKTAAQASQEGRRPAERAVPATPVQGDTENAAPAASPGISEFTDKPVSLDPPKRKRTKPRKNETPLQKVRRQYSDEKAYSEMLMEYSEKLRESHAAIAERADEMAVGGLDIRQRERSSRLRDENDRLHAEVQRLNHDRDAMDDRIARLEHDNAKLRQQVAEGAGGRQVVMPTASLRQPIEHWPMDSPAIMASLVTPPHNTVLEVSQTHEGEPVYRNHATRGGYAGQVLVLRPVPVDGKGTALVRYRCPLEDQPGEVRGYTERGYHAEVVYGVDNLRDRIVWYAQLDETQPPAE